MLIREAGGARLVTTIAGATALALSPGGHRLATRRGALVELLGGRALVRVQHPGARGHAIADSGALATAADGEVRIWSPAGKRIASVSLGAPVSHLEWSRGERLAIAAGDRVVVWEASRGPRVLRGGLGADRASERASDRASVLASGSGPNSASGSTSEPAPAQAAGSPAPTGQILALRWGDDDTLIAGLDDGCAQRWSLGRGHVDAILRRTRAAIVDLAVDDRTDVALTRSADGALRRWHLGDAGGVVLARRDREVAALAVHASGERRASGGADGRIDLWNGVLVARAGPRPPDHTIVCGEAIQAVALGATWLVGGDVSGRLCARRIADDGALEPAAIRSHITTRAITALAIDDAEHWLAVGDSDGGVQIVDLEAAAGRPRRWLPPRPGGSWIMSLSFETGSARLLAAAADGALTLGPADARPTRVGEGGEPGPRLRVAVWGPGPAAIVAGDDGWIRSIAIDHDTRGPGARIGHHPAAIWDLVVGPVVGGGGQGSGRAAWIASAGADGSILVWPPEPGERGLTLRGHRGEVLALARDPDDDHLLSAGEDGTVRRWPLALDDRLARLGDAAHVCVASAIVDELRTSGIVDGPPACPD
ncbi:MAG: WD40 repeat domain-containing protein [Nannocystaceae bacterium]